MDSACLITGWMYGPLHPFCSDISLKQVWETWMQFSGPLHLSLGAFLSSQPSLGLLHTLLECFCLTWRHPCTLIIAWMEDSGWCVKARLLCNAHIYSHGSVHFFFCLCPPLEGFSKENVALRLKTVPHCLRLFSSAIRCTTMVMVATVLLRVHRFTVFKC